MRFFDVVKFGCLGLLAILVLSCAGVVDKPEKDGFSVGEVAPDFRLAKLDGEMIRLSDYRGDKGVVVVFSRGHWWPYCVKQLVQLQELYDDFESLGYEVMMIFREDTDGGIGMRRVVDMGKITYPVMLDLSGEQTPAYSRDGFDTYIIGKNGVVKARVDGVKTQRPLGNEILACVKKVGP